jgi:hypothetical protein
LHKSPENAATSIDDSTLEDLKQYVATEVGVPFPKKLNITLFRQSYHVFELYLECSIGHSQLIDLQIKVRYIEHSIHPLERKWYVQDCLQKCINFAKLGRWIILEISQLKLFLVGGNQLSKHPQRF